jgi:hypothetical protein
MCVRTGKKIMAQGLTGDCQSGCPMSASLFVPFFLPSLSLFLSLSLCVCVCVCVCPQQAWGDKARISPLEMKSRTHGCGQQDKELRELQECQTVVSFRLHACNPLNPKDDDHQPTNHLVTLLHSPSPLMVPPFPVPNDRAPSGCRGGK